MLETLLRHWDPSIDWQTLITRTGLTDAQLRNATEDLLRLGYLRAESASCGGGCAGCSISTCRAGETGRMLSLTERGKHKRNAILLHEKNE